MKSKKMYFNIILLLIITITSCNRKEVPSEMKMIFLHHSTGDIIWNGTPPSLLKRVVGKISENLADIISKKPLLPTLIDKYNEKNNSNFFIEEIDFPKASPYGWNNNPYNYYDIWIKNAGENPYKEEPTLEILTKDYQLIIFKHCFPVSNIKPDQDTADINSWVPTISNYKLQYLALRDKLQTFHETKFILFTGAVQVKFFLQEDEAKRAKEFFEWVRDEWDLPNDNIYLWDLYTLETKGDLYLRNEYSISATDSHINKAFATNAAKLLFNRIIDVITNNGQGTQLTGEIK